MTLPKSYAQVNAIYRAPGDKAIVVGECGGMCSGFLIVDLRLGAIVDGDISAAWDPIISPDRRFIFYKNWNEPHSGGENLYHIYDLLKTPRENVCGYRQNDPKHEHLDDSMRGFQVYPQRPGQVSCSDLEDEDDDNVGFRFTWAPDSSKIVFADVKDGVMSLVLVTMPVGAKDLPKTSTYALAGEENVCAGMERCDFHAVKSLEFQGDAVKAVFDRPGNRTAVQRGMTIPHSRFITIDK